MLLLILSIAFLSVRVNVEEAPKITFISLSGNTHLNVENYFKFTRLDEKENYKYLSVNIIKDRFEKHPYIETASVKLEPDNKVYVEISEKTFEAMFIIFSFTPCPISTAAVLTETEPSVYILKTIPF